MLHSILRTLPPHHGAVWSDHTGGIYRQECLDVFAHLLASFCCTTPLALLGCAPLEYRRRPFAHYLYPRPFDLYSLPDYSLACLFTHSFRLLTPFAYQHPRVLNPSRARSALPTPLPTSHARSALPTPSPTQPFPCSLRSQASLCLSFAKGLVQAEAEQLQAAGSGDVPTAGENGDELMDMARRSARLYLLDASKELAFAAALTAGEYDVAEVERFLALQALKRRAAVAVKVRIRGGTHRVRSASVAATRCLVTHAYTPPPRTPAKILRPIHAVSDTRPPRSVFLHRSPRSPTLSSLVFNSSSHVRHFLRPGPSCVR